MRTWKQGIIGEIGLSQSTSLFVHCLKYPLAKIYKDFERDNQNLNNYMFSIMIDKSVLKSITRVGEKKLSREENKEGKAFVFDSKESKIYREKIMGKGNQLLERVHKLEEIIDKYNTD